jgi:hypothetical protein
LLPDAAGPERSVRIPTVYVWPAAPVTPPADLEELLQAAAIITPAAATASSFALVDILIPPVVRY